MADAKRALAEGYSRSAREYDSLAGSAYQAGILRLLPRAQPVPSPAVLDVGCGTGINLLEAVKRFGPCGKAAGIDLAPGMIEAAREKFAAAGINAELVVGDAEELPWPDRTFDLVICNSVYHWFGNPERALREMRRVLKPGGQLLLLTAIQPCYIEWFSLLREVLAKEGGPNAASHLPKLPTAQEVGNRLLHVGFALPHFQPQVERLPVPDPSLFTRQLSTVAPAWAVELTPAGQQQVEEAVADQLGRRGSGGFLVTWAALEAVAVRP